MTTEHDVQIPGPRQSAPQTAALVTVDELQQLLDAERAAHAETTRRLNEATTVAHAAGLKTSAFIPTTEHGRAAIAASQHLHMTSVECLKAGVARVCLCADGWFVPPELRTN